MVLPPEIASGAFATMTTALRAGLDAKQVKRVIFVVPPGPTPAEVLQRISDLPLGAGRPMPWPPGWT